MLYRRFGRTGLAMPVLSFGCMRSMYAWPDNPNAPIPDDAQQSLAAILDQALAHGITHIETAHGYGSSERQLGHLLPRHPRSELILQTKVVPHADPEEFVAGVSLSMKRLQVDYLDLLAIHGINDFRSLWYTCRKGGCLAAARTLQDRGLVRHIGFSGHGPPDVIRQALLHQEDGGFDFLNVHWYYILDVNRTAIELARAKDLGVLIISPNDKGGHLHTPSDELKRLCAPLSPMVFNDIWCLQNPGVSTISIGASAPYQFDEHLQVMDLLTKKNDDLVSQIDRRLRHRMYEMTGSHRPDSLWQLLPSWDNAPGNINLPMIVWLYNLVRGWDMLNFAQARYRLLGEGSSWVPGSNGATSSSCDFSKLQHPDGLTHDQLKELMIRAHAILQ